MAVKSRQSFIGRVLIALTVLLASKAWPAEITVEHDYQKNVAGAVNLGVHGTTDWIHFGAGGVASAVNRKAGGGSRFTNLTLLNGATKVAGTGSLGNWSTLSWTGGSPTASHAGTRAFVSMTPLNGGYQFSVPADTRTREVKVYLGHASSTSRVRLSLSDSSAATQTIDLPNQSLADHYIFRRFRQSCGSF